MSSRIWAGVLVVSLVAIGVALRPVPEPAVQPARAPVPLFREARPDAVASFIVRRASGAVRRERGAAWDAPTRERLRLLLGARLERGDALGEADPARYGLAAPALRARVVVDGDDPGATELDVGDAAPDGLSHYVATRPGPRVAKLPSYQIENLVALAEDPVASPSP